MASNEAIRLLCGEFAIEIRLPSVVGLLHFIRHDNRKVYMKLSTRIFLGFSLIIVISIINSYVNQMLSQKVKRNIEFLSTSESLIRNSTRLHKTIIDMQSAFRGFLLTDDTTFLKPYYSGLKDTPGLFKQQFALVKSSKSQELKLDSISNLLDQWTSYSTKLIEARQNNNISQPNDYTILFETKLKAQVGKKLNDQISEIFLRFDRFEYGIREMRRDQLIKSITQTEYYSVIFIVLTIFIGFVSIIYIIRIISTRIASMVNLADNISKGNFIKVEDDGNDELTSLSNSLNLMSSTLSKNIKELEKRNKELDQYAYVVSHDLKAPLRGIYNAIQWIEEDLGNELSDQMKKYLSIIPERIMRMDDLIDGLLNYARISREQPLKEQVDVQNLLRNITEVIVPKDFVLKIKEMPTLETEKIKLEQVFSNLISNAVKYTPEGKGIITITSNELPRFYEFTVSDNGIGIDPEYHEKIFVIFQTLREKDAKESTGIGLAIVHKIIEDQHCTIKVVSEHGKGASFIFTWPKK